MNQLLLKETRSNWRKNLLRAGFVLVALICLAETARAQAIVGTVKTVAGVPIDGVLVRGVRTIPSLQVVTTTTDVSGGYVLGAGLSGTYTVQAIETGYTFTPATTNVTVSGSSVFGVNFTSPSTVPVATTSSATNVTATGATPLGSVNPNGGTTTAYFEYGLTAGYGTTSSSVNVGSGTGFVPVSIGVTGLLNATNYHFRIVASNSHGTRTGSDTNFTTLSGIPTVTTREPTDGGATTMRLNGSVNPNSANATAWFEVGTTTNYGIPFVPQNVGSGTASTNFNQMIGGLSAGTTYHYRAVAATSFGTNYGADVLFIPGFGDISAGLPGVAYSSVAWGDYSNDGQLDILLTGINTNAQLISRLWRNTGSGFVNVGVGLAGVYFGSVVWGDYDNDGRLDLLFTGESNPGGPIAQVWRSNGSTFTNFNAGLPGVKDSSAAWGDYDNDGRLDILLTGLSPVTDGRISQVWRNTGSGFVNINAGLPGVHRSSVAWGDYDNDGRLDILLTGSGDSNRISQVWRNTGSGFANIIAGLPGVDRGSAAWGDYDNDGRLDILLTGDSDSGNISQVWRNTGSGFVNINAGLPGVNFSSAAWGDFDNDGRLDILLAGSTDLGNLLKVWRNTGSGFTDINAGLPEIRDGSVAWGDYDNDGRLDILVTGFNANNTPSAQVWRNNLPTPNTAPGTPSGLNLTVSNTVATLTWDPAADNETPAAGLTYNLRIGTTPGGSDVLSPMSGADGLRRVPRLGGAQHGLSATLNYTLGSSYYWSVQAVDSAFSGSPFAPESSFKLLPVAVPVASSSIIPGDLNGDGMVDQAELDAALANYWPYSPWLYMTNIAGLGGTNVTFALSNSTAGAFSVEYTTNFVNWQSLGPATPRYLFTDTNAPAVPQRYYRLRWP